MSSTPDRHLVAPRGQTGPAVELVLQRIRAFDQWVRGRHASFAVCVDQGHPAPIVAGMVSAAKVVTNSIVESMVSADSTAPIWASTAVNSSNR